MKAVMVAALLVIIEPVQAYPSHFDCVVISESTLQADGTMSVKKIPEGSVYFKQRFVVDKASGNVRGSLFTNEGAGKITIMDNGSNPQNAFHVYWTGTKRASAPFWNLFVESFKQPISPFIFLQGGSLFSGVCR